jgi:hypothetical protein
MAGREEGNPGSQGWPSRKGAKARPKPSQPSYLSRSSPAWIKADPMPWRCDSGRPATGPKPCQPADAPSI